MKPTQEEREYLERNSDAARARKKKKAMKRALGISGKRIRKIASRMKMEKNGTWKGRKK